RNFGSPAETYLVVLLFIGGVHAVGVLFSGLFQPLLDMHGFRQTQTAISAYWMVHGGPWLAYETPVMGYPWAIPFEFPVYQGLVALLALIGVPIDVGGRLVSFAFFAACLAPLWTIFRAFNWPRTTYLAIATLFIASPIYTFWARTVMIETTAVFFGL